MGERDDLTASGLHHRYGDRVVLDGVDLDVPAGRVVGLLGPNGAGKTTLMRILFGVLRPDAGHVTWRGRAATDADRRSWGYMPQERGLYRDMRVHDQLTWIARLHGLDRATARRRAQDLLERLGLGDRGREELQNLSGGMAQRVQLAAAMVHGPEVLVLDEPFAGLDPVAVEFLTAVITDHVRDGGVLLLSTHQLDLAQELCDSIVLVHHGRVVLRGEIHRLRTESPHRFLRVDVDVDETWLHGHDVTIADRERGGARIRLGAAADAVAVLDAVRAHAPVRDFAVETPTLSELFLAAAGDEAAAEDLR